MTDPTELQRLERAIARLPRRQRMIFMAMRFDDLSYVEIAEVTGLRVLEVEQLLAKALYNIARRMDRAPRRRWWRLW